jgi:hypothetical protein
LRFARRDGFGYKAGRFSERRNCREEREVMTKHIVAVVGVALVVLAGLAGRASAQSQGRPCQPDIEKLCKGVQTGGGRIRECLKSHASELSPNCKKMYDSKKGIFSEDTPAHANRRQAMLEACKPELEKFCKGIQPGGGRLKVCLEQHRSELSDACTKAFPGSKEGKAAPQPK